jgi:hypothetical protein
MSPILQGFVTGYDFSHADKAIKITSGFSPCKGWWRPRSEMGPFSPSCLAAEGWFQA